MRYVIWSWFNFKHGLSSCNYLQQPCNANTICKPSAEQLIIHLVRNLSFGAATVSLQFHEKHKFQLAGHINSMELVIATLGLIWMWLLFKVIIHIKLTAKNESLWSYKLFPESGQYLLRCYFLYITLSLLMVRLVHAEQLENGWTGLMSFQE